MKKLTFVEFLVNEITEGIKKEEKMSYLENLANEFEDEKFELMKNIYEEIKNKSNIIIEYGIDFDDEYDDSMVYMRAFYQNFAKKLKFPEHSEDIKVILDYFNNFKDNEKEKDKDKEIIITSDNKTTEDANYNKINNINNSIKKKNIMPYVNPSVKIMHRNIIASKNFKQKNYLPKINIDLSKSSNYFTPITPKIIDTNKSVENISFGSKNKINPSTNNYLTNTQDIEKRDRKSKTLNRNNFS